MVESTRNFNSSSIAIRWLASYFGILLVPIIISGCIYKVSISILEQEINNSHQSLLMQVQQTVDGRLNDIDQICSEIYNDRNIMQVKDLRGNFTNEDTYKVVTAARSMDIYLGGRDYIDSFYIYYKNTGMLLRSNGSVQSQEIYLNNTVYNGISQDDWRKILSDDSYRSIYSVNRKSESGNSEKSIIFSKVISIYNPDMKAIFIIDSNKLLNNTKSIPLINDSNLFVLSGDKGVIASSGKQLQQLQPVYADMKYDTGYLHQRAQEDSVVSYITSSKTDWKYVLVTESAVFWKKVKYIKELIYISIFLCLVLGGIISFVLTKTNYKVVSDVVDTLRVKLRISAKKRFNELRFIQEAVQNTLNEREKIQNKLDSQIKIMRQNFLSRLLKGGDGLVTPNEAMLMEYDVNFESDKFSVILFYIEDYSQFFSSERDMDIYEKYDLITFILTNVVEEIANRENKGYVAEVDNMLACIMNFKKEDKLENLSEMKRVSEEVKFFLKEKFGICMSISLSGIQEGMKNIHLAFKEAIEAMEYKLIDGGLKVISYDEIFNKSRRDLNFSYYYPIQIEQQLINFIKVGDFEHSSKIVEEIFNKNFNNSTNSVKLAQCLIFNIIGTMIKTINETGSMHGKNYIEELKPIDRLTNCKTLNRIKEETYSILNEICRYITIESESIENMFYLEVNKYIEENYSNANLTITTVGEHFGLAPYYLSRLYKEQTENNLLDYIQKVRVERSKEILVRNKCTIQEAASLVGYEDTNTFTRIFKKYEGITPGKYKDSYKNI